MEALVMQKNKRYLICSSFLTLMIVSVFTLYLIPFGHVQKQPQGGNLFEMSIEDLMDVEISFYQMPRIQQGLDSLFEMPIEALLDVQIEPVALLVKHFFLLA
jgi:hypothetical protein